MRHAVFFLLVFGLRTLAALPENAGKAYDPPTLNHPWQHEVSGLRFPNKLGPLVAQGIFVYEEESLGTMMRYVSEKLRIRADIFLYPCKLPLGTPDKMMAAAGEEAGNVLGEIKGAEKQGVYSDIKEGEATYTDLELFEEDPTQSCVLTMPVTLTIHQDNGAGKVEDRVNSLTVLMVYGSTFVKIRCTYPLEEDKKREDAVEEFVKQTRRCLMDPGMRKRAKGQIQEYRADPLSARARDVAGGVLVYAENTPIFGFTVHTVIGQLGESVEKDFSDAPLDVMRAFIVGAVAAAIQEPLPKKVDVEEEGAAEIVKLYDLMKSRKAGLQSGLMEELVAAVKKKEGAGWLRAKGAEEDAKGK